MLDIIHNRQSFFYIDELVLHRCINQSNVWSKEGQPIVNAAANLRSTSMVLVAVMDSYGRV